MKASIIENENIDGTLVLGIYEGTTEVVNDAGMAKDLKAKIETILELVISRQRKILHYQSSEVQKVIHFCLVLERKTKLIQALSGMLEQNLLQAKNISEISSQ